MSASRTTTTSSVSLRGALLGHLREYRRDPLSLFLRLQRWHGDVVRLRLGPRWAYLVSHPEDLRHVFAVNAANYERPTLYDRGKVVFGEASFTSRGEAWLRKRRAVSSLFHPRSLEHLSEGIVGEIERTVAGWERFAAEGRAFNVVPESLLLTLAISTKTLLGFDPGDARGRLCAAVEEVLSYLKVRLEALVAVPVALPTPRNLRFQRAMALLDDVVYRIIDRCREQGCTGDDVISTLVRARDEGDDAIVTDRDLRDEIITFFLAGFHTSADSLSWTLYQIAPRPEVQEAVRVELGRLDADGTPAIADLDALPYTQAVVKESMRLYPPSWFIPRRPIRDDVIGEVRVPRGSLVFASQWVTHRHPAVWEDPERFDPARFLPGAPAVPRHAYFPFGAGPQACIGKNLAMMELPMMLGGILGRFRLDLEPGQAVGTCPGMTLRPAGEIRIRLERAPVRRLPSVSTASRARPGQTLPSAAS